MTRKRPVMSYGGLENIAIVPSDSNALPLVLFFAFKIIPSLVAALSIYFGYRLFVLGVTGQASLIVNAQSIKAQLLNAAPGLFFAVGGIVTLIATVWKGVHLHLPDPRSSSAADFRGLV